MVDKSKSKIEYERLLRDRRFEAVKFSNDGRINYVLKKNYRTKEGEWKSEMIHLFPNELDSASKVLASILQNYRSGGIDQLVDEKVLES